MHDISTADSGSMYPHTATVFTGSADIEEKYNKQPSPVFINPRKTRGEILLCGILISSGIIRIGTFSSVAAHWLPNIIRAYRKIGVVFKIQKTLSAAAKEFLKYLDFRNG